MGRKAWTAQELAPKLGLTPHCARRYLKIYYQARRLDRKHFGVLWYYVVARFVEPPDLSYSCPYCKGRMDVYNVKRCGCQFQICAIDDRHSNFQYCEKHRIVTAVIGRDKGGEKRE